MKQRPGARAGVPETSPEGKSLLTDADNPRREPRIIWNKDGVSPHRTPQGNRRLGRNEIDPDSIPWDRGQPAPTLGRETVIDVLIIERSATGGAWRFRHGRVANQDVPLNELKLEDGWESEVVGGSGIGITLQIAFGKFLQSIRQRMGTPGLLGMIE